MAHEIAARPVMRGADSELAFRLYRRAQQLDEFEGEGYSGTSVLAGMKAATEAGYYSEYRWAFGIEDLVRAVGYHGPAVLGLNWYEGMFEPQSGVISATGSIAGGHCILMRGVTLRFTGSTRDFASIDMDRSSALLRNSWGRGWGDNGDCRVTLRDLDRLLHEGGEAAVPVTRK